MTAETAEVVHLRRGPDPITCGETGRVRVTRVFREVTCQDCIDAEDERLGRRAQVVDRPGTDGKHTGLTVERGRLAQWPVKLTVQMGYGDTTSLHLNAAEAAELVTAIQAQTGPDPRIKELEAERDCYKEMFHQDEELIEKLGAQIVSLRGDGR